MSPRRKKTAAPVEPPVELVEPVAPEPEPSPLLVCDRCRQPLDLANAAEMRWHNNACTGRHFSAPSALRHPAHS